MKFHKQLCGLAFLLVAAACSSDNDPGDETAQGNPVYLDGNGITVKAREWAEVGDTGEIDGIEYTVVDNLYLKALAGDYAKVRTACTTRVTNMDGLFAGDLTSNGFNGDISSWDVSNVTSMSGMFRFSLFNKPIGNWDVSNVVDMSQMFWAAGDFNQDLSGWDVSNVANCTDFDMEANSWTSPKPALTCAIN